MLYKELFVNRKCGYYNVGTGVGTSLLDQIKGMIEVFGEDGTAWFLRTGTHEEIFGN